jgi:uncharacterized protein (TIGR03083 family)
MSNGTLLLRTDGACDFDPGHLLDVFGEQRNRFIAVVREFDRADWAAPTRCPDWTAHDVVRHLCDTTAIALGTGDRTIDMAAGFDPRVSPCQWLKASDGEPPDATISRLGMATDRLIGEARSRLAQGQKLGVGLPFGQMDWTVMLLHAMWDSWVHERDVLLARGAEHPADAETNHYVAAYGMFISAAVASMFFGDEFHEKLTLGGDGGGVFDLDCDDTVTLTVSHTGSAGPSVAEVTDALAGRPPTAAVLGNLPATVRTPLSHMANFFNTPVDFALDY